MTTRGEGRHAKPTLRSRNVILRGASWTTLAQLAPVVVNIVLTPRLLGYLGAERYGLYVLCFAVIAFLGSFDGGISSSVLRWSAIYSGADDRAANTRLITSISAVVTLVGAILFGILFIGAPSIMSLFGVSAEVSDEGVFLLRCLALVLGISQLRGLFGAQLLARQRFALQSIISIASYVVYAIGIITTVDEDFGLRGIGITFVAQAAVVTVVLVPAGCRYLDRRSIGFLSWTDLRTFIAYSSKVQGIGLTNLVTQQADTFIVGRFLSVATVAVYGTGASFANQLRTVFLNALPPMATSLAQAFGRGGDDEVLADFSRLQRRWVQAVAAWCSVGVAASYFGVQRWLGPGYEMAGTVAAVLLASFAFNLWTGALVVLLSTVGRPEIELRYAVVGVIINLSLTVPLLLAFGLIGTVAATATGTTLASLYLVGITQRRYRRDVPSFLREVPVLPIVVTIAVVAILEIVADPFVPGGPWGLICSGLLAAPGFVVFGVALMGPRPAAALVLSQWRSRRSRVMTTADSE